MGAMARAKQRQIHKAAFVHNEQSSTRRFASLLASPFTLFLCAIRFAHLRLVQKAKARLQSIFADRTGALSSVDVKGARDILRELEEKKESIGLMQQEARRLHAAMDLARSYRATIEEGGGSGTGEKSFIAANRLERSVGGEKAILDRMKMFPVGEAEREDEKKEDGAAGKGDKGEKTIPTSSLATLLSTVFNPKNLE